MDRKWTHILNDGPDDSIGAAIVRLARMAADAHELEAMAQDADVRDVEDDSPVATARRTSAHPLAVDLPLTTRATR